MITIQHSHGLGVQGKDRWRGMQHGYVLLFVLGLLAVVTTLVLSVTVTLRLDAQLLGREKAALQEEYLLRGALRFTAFQLGVTSAVQDIKPPLSQEARRQWMLWHPVQRSYEVLLGAKSVVIELEDVSGLPDANMLSLQEWQRILLVAGTPTREAALDLATRIMEVREQLVYTRGTLGFSSLQDLLEWPEIPASIVRGGGDSNPLGLKHLIVVGTRNKKVNINTTPLPLLKALGTVSEEHLQQLATLRSSGPLGAAAAQQWLQGTGLTAHANDAFPASVRARVRLASTPVDGAAMVGVLASENGAFVVVDQMLDKGRVGH